VKAYYLTNLVVKLKQMCTIIEFKTGMCVGLWNWIPWRLLFFFSKIL